MTETNSGVAAPEIPTDDTARIRALNDRLRTTLTGGRIMVTAGVMARGAEFRMDCCKAVAEFANFTDGNDPHREHDFGSFEMEGETIFWKIDYYDLDLECGSSNPADPAVTTRVLTILLASEY